MLQRLEKFINRDKYLIDWRKKAYKELNFIGLTDEEILFILQGRLDHPTTCREWCIKNQYPFIKIWAIIK